MINDLDINELNDRVETELAQQKKIVPGVMLAISLFVLVVFSIISVGMASDGDSEVALFMAIMGGAMAVFFQFMSFVITSGIADTSMRTKLVSRAMAKMLSELPKRKKGLRNQLDDEIPVDEGEVVMLGDDGELKRARR